MITYEQALACIVDAVEPLAAVELSSAASLGCVAATDVRSRLNVPDFDNAAMDGIAVRACDTDGAGDECPVTLSIAGSVAAGQAPGRHLDAGTAIEIMTGAPVPDGADTVIPIERIELTDSGDARTAEIKAPADSGRNIRRAGEDFRQDDLLLPAGSQITPQALMNLAASGNDRVAVRPKPIVSVITTGRELTAAGTPTGTGQIRDANGPYLSAALPRFGAQSGSVAAAGDDLDSVAEAMAAAAENSQLVITTGGVSAGRFDCVPDAVKALGGRLLFHRVAIRPGKPVLFASLPGGRWLLGLPGNPVAVVVGLRFFGAAVLDQLRGGAPEEFLTARTTHAIDKRAGLRFFGKARALVSESGELQVELLPGQESFRIRPLLESNCWAIVDEGKAQVPAGELIQIAPRFPSEFLHPAVR